MSLQPIDPPSLESPQPQVSPIRAIEFAPSPSPSSNGARSASPAGRGREVALLRDAAAGDAQALRSLIDEHLTAIHGFAYVSVGESAVEDIMQETLIEAIRSASSFRGESSLNTWLHTIAKRRVFRQYAKERRQREVSEMLSLETETSEILIDRRDQVARALDKLSPIHRQVIVMKYLNDLSVLQIAEELGKTRVQVQSLLQRARFALREALGHEGF